MSLGEPGNEARFHRHHKGNLISYLFFILAQILLFRWMVETLLVWLGWKQIAVGGVNITFSFSSTG